MAIKASKVPVKVQRKLDQRARYLSVFNRDSYSLDELRAIALEHLTIGGKRAGKLNAAITRQRWYQESSFFEALKLHSAYESSNARLRAILDNFPKCCICGSSASWYNNGFLSTCGKNSCISSTITSRRITTNLEKYGAKVSLKTREATRLRVPALNEKARKTIFERYGVQYTGQIPGQVEKREATMMERYGVAYASQIPAVLERSKQRSLELREEQLPSINILNIDDSSPRRISYECKTCSFTETLTDGALLHRQKIAGTACGRCSGIDQHGSFEQAELYRFTQALAPDARSNVRSVISPYEFDVWVPSKRVAIEYHGIFWHSSADDNGTQMNMHLIKHQLAQAQGIKLLQFISTHPKQVVRSVISHALGQSIKVGARRCTITELKTQVANSLLEEWHLNGAVRAAPYALGLTLDGEVMAVATFGKSRYERNSERYELYRFATRLNHAVVGGLSRLTQSFLERTPSCNALTSYADRFMGDGGGYVAAGFKRIGETPPNYWYWHPALGERLISRYQAQKHKLKELLGDGFDQALTERQNMLHAGFRIFRDAGNVKFELAR